MVNLCYMHILTIGDINQTLSTYKFVVVSLHAIRFLNSSHFLSVAFMQRRHLSVSSAFHRLFSRTDTFHLEHCLRSAAIRFNDLQ